MKILSNHRVNLALEFFKRNPELNTVGKLQSLVKFLQDGCDYNATMEIDVLDKSARQIESLIRLGIKSFAPMEVTYLMMNGLLERDFEKSEYTGSINGPAEFVRDAFALVGLESKILRHRDYSPVKFFLVVYLPV